MRAARPVLLAPALVLVAAFPAAAPAAVRYAAPAGTGAPPCAEAAPCSLEDAVSAAAANDTVRLAEGTYELTSTLALEDQGLALEGPETGPRPVLAYAGPQTESAVGVRATDITLRRLVVRGATDPAHELVAGGGPAAAGLLVDRAELRNTGQSPALVAQAAAVRDSVLTSAAGAGAAAVLSGAVTGSTILAPDGAALSIDTDSFFVGAQTLRVRNSILRGGPTQADLIVQGDATGKATADVDFTSLRDERIQLYPAGDETARELILGPKNLTSPPPLLVDLPGGLDVHQLDGSPTINAGSPAAVRAADSREDYEGDPRVIGAVPDIGADEATLPPLAITGAANVLDGTTATLSGAVNSGGMPTRYAFLYGPTTAYGSATPVAGLTPAGTSEVVVSAVTGLAPGATYHARLVATNAKGSAFGADVVFATPAPAVDRTPPRIGNPELSRPRVRRGKGSTVRFSLSENATVRLTLEKRIDGRRVAGRCERKARRGRKCTRHVKLTTRRKTLSGGSGLRIAVPVRVRGKLLSKGRYRVTLVATDAAGNRSRSRRLTLRVR